MDNINRVGNSKKHSEMLEKTLIEMNSAFGGAHQ